ncbi:hypothetical protein niasHT_028448 [Heterodera trifolii]|uniref:BTB/POZ domain-containing protein n=1 Tax=Heterodera trifolii TaxID=157864 RepID=A0ABD2KPU5_9BILA
MNSSIMSSPSKQGNSNERMKHLLSSGEDADVHFLVGDGDKKELLPAHKLILKHASDVFEAMFRFDSKEPKTENASVQSAVEVPDVEPAAFRVMLSFIYADDLSALNGDNAMALLYAAKKYGIDRLVNECLQIPIPQLSNVFLAFAQARLFEFEDFACQCLRFICQNARQLFESVEFLQIDQKLLCEIFDCDQLVISSEFEIWKAALRWSDRKCRQNAIECSAENRRAALGPALFKIRFPLIPSDAFVKQIVPSGVLSNDEFVGVFQFHCHPNFCGVPGLYPLKFLTQTRISDWNISMGNRGTVTLEIEKFSEFAREEEGNERSSETEVYIKGIPWKISAETEIDEKSNEKWLGFYLWCTTPTTENGKWNCKCSATFRIVSLKSGTENSIGKIAIWGFENFIAFAELLDPCKGFHDKNEDKVTLAIDIFVEEENREKFDLNPNKSNGTIEMEIGKLSEFAREIIGSERSSETVFVKGIPWKMSVETEIDGESKEKWLKFYLWCTAPTAESENWSCKCSATFRIVSLKSGTENSIVKFFDRVFNNERTIWGFENFTTIAELMDPSKGFYDKGGDKVTFAIDIFVEEENEEKFDPNPNKFNGTIEMEIDKLSEFAREIRGSERSSETLFVKGIPWKISARIMSKKNDKTNKWLGFALECSPQKDSNWSCECSATVRILSQKSGKDGLTQKIDAKRFFSAKEYLGFRTLIPFVNLMGPSSALYDKDGDKVTLAIDFTVEEKKGTKRKLADD